MKSIIETRFDFPGQTAKYTGKVRDVYTIDDRILVMIATDRISAFDVVFPKGITYKGQILNKIASRFLDDTADIVSNWKIASPHPWSPSGTNANLSRWKRSYAEPYRKFMRTYKSGARTLCGIPLPEGMRELRL
jgi:phosphoribosylaminoimidazole-succinocarboxamide synthase